MPEADLGDVRLHYRVRGEGPPVLGIMGFALDQRYWAGQIPAVTATRSFVTFDNRGIGRSSGPPPTSIEQMADDAAGLLDHLGIDRTVVFGVSMGGTIAQRLALAHPERVEALVLALTWARPIEFMRRQHEVARTIIESGGNLAFLDASLIRMFTPEFFETGRDIVDRMVEVFLAEEDEPPLDVLMAQLDACDKHDTLAELSSISCPTLVVGAEKDFMVPAFAAREIADAIPGAELVMMATGHGCMLEEMDTFNAAVTKFLAALP